MEDNLFRGEKVDLTMADPEAIAGLLSRWYRNSEYGRLADFWLSPFFSVKATKESLEKEILEDPLKFTYFLIRSLDDQRIVGEIGLDEFKYAHRGPFVGISIGDPKDWGKGYGTDAMRVMLRYAFTELNLHQVTLLVFEYNPRAIHSYEKAGFRVRGRMRKAVNRDGQRWDAIAMSILRQEWDAQNSKTME